MYYLKKNCWLSLSKTVVFCKVSLISIHDNDDILAGGNTGGWNQGGGGGGNFGSNYGQNSYGGGPMKSGGYTQRSSGPYGGLCMCVCVCVL